MYLFIVLGLPKKMGLLLDSLPPANCAHWGWINLAIRLSITCILTHCKSLHIKKLCNSFKSMYQELFKHTEVRKQSMNVDFLFCIVLCRGRTMFYRFSINRNSRSKTDFCHIFNMASSGLRKCCTL